MSEARGALQFLLERTTRNWIRRQGARMRKPQYGFAMLVALAYFGFIVFGPGATDPNHHGNVIQLALTSIGLLLLLVTPWLIRETNALALSPAEVGLLFPAPLTRHQLLGFRIARSQLVILINALVWASLLGRFLTTTAWPQRFAESWAILSLVSLHQLMVALLRVRPMSPSRTVIVRAGQLVAIVAILALLRGAVPLMLAVQHNGIMALLSGFQTLQTTAPASYIFAATGVLLRPLLAPALAQWAAAFVIPVALIALHMLLILRIDVRFEDQATAASARKAKQSASMRGFRSGRLTISPKTRSRIGLPLASHGSPLLALGWKNSTALLRSQAGRSLPITLGLILVMMRITNSGAHESPPWLGYAIISGMLIGFGPRMLRNDLRQDLAHLAQLRTWPLSARQIVLGQILSATVILSVLELIFVALALHAAALGIPSDSLGLAATVVVGAASVVAIVTINLMNIGLQNGLALLYPGWVRIGIDAGGVEAFGQTILATGATMLALIISLIAPGALLIALAALTRSLAGSSTLVNIAVGIIPAATLLAIEVIGLLQYLGRLLERTEPSDVG